jgi:hypothetical protein
MCTASNDCVLNLVRTGIGSSNIVIITAAIVTATVIHDSDIVSDQSIWREMQGAHSTV